MSYESKSFAEITTSMLEQLTKAVVRENLVYDPSKVRYRLSAGEEGIRDVVKVDGQVKGLRTPFAKGADYRLSDGMFEWVDGGKKPDAMSTFEVSYLFGNPSPITDVNPGSVVRTIVEAIGREIEYLYAQNDYVYKAGFIDTATGNSLDLVVAILGVQRRPAQFATGLVTFGRRKPPPELPPQEQVVIFDGGRKYVLKRSPVFDITSVKGMVHAQPLVFKKGADYAMEGDSIAWLDGAKPDYRTEFRVTYKAYQQVPIPKGTKLSTFSRRRQDVKLFETTQEAYLQKNPLGVWEVDVPVKALEAGPGGNVLSGSVTLMPQPVETIEFVVNREALSGGTEPETDDVLRDRAKKGLRALGRATYNSLKQRIEEIEGVVRPVRIDELPVLYSVETGGRAVDLPVPGVVRVIVDGGDMEKIKEAVDDTRAAGVYVQILRPKFVLMDVRLFLQLQDGTQPSDVEETIKGGIEEYVGSVTAGETVIFGRLVSVALSAKGVTDVKSLSVDCYRDGQPAGSSSRENIALNPDEKPKVRTVSVQAG
jgi:uncharacterized phage protein gp47/JayE